MKVKIQINEDNIITGYFCLISENPYRVSACNWYEELSSVEIEVNDLKEISVNRCKYINNNIIPIEEVQDVN